MGLPPVEMMQFFVELLDQLEQEHKAQEDASR
jgi:hypothetical protein